MIALPFVAIGVVLAGLVASSPPLVALYLLAAAVGWPLTAALAVFIIAMTSFAILVQKLS